MTKRKNLEDAEPVVVTEATPSLDEYYSQRAAEEQNLYYLQGSRNRKESYLLKEHIPYKEPSGYDLQRLINLADELSKENNVPRAEIISRAKSKTLKGFEQLNGYKSDWYNYVIRELEKGFSNSGYDAFLANCIATATSNNPNKGHFVTGNLSFAANPKKFGFTKVKKSDAKPGSLVQVVTGGIPVHAMVLNSNDDGIETFNYSPGSYPQYKTNAKYPVGKEHGNYLDYYNFVGNEADSARWKKEYDERYNRKLGGTLPELEVRPKLKSSEKRRIARRELAKQRLLSEIAPNIANILYYPYNII